MRAQVIPDDDQSCGWLAALPPPGAARRLSGRQHADSVVIGAGFTGLAAARQLARHEPQSRVVLLEAQRVGSGASGRNSGFVQDVAHYEEQLGLEGNRRLIGLARAGIAHLREIVQAHGIECAWNDRGPILHGAVEDIGMRALDRFCRGLDELGEPFEMLDAEAVAAITGTPYYRAAARTRGGVLVQPAALVRGLAASLPANVELFEESPVHAVHQGRELCLECAHGTVVANRLLLATNGFTPSLGFLKRRIFPMLTFASLTRPLLDNEQKVLAGEPEWGLVPEERMGTTVRRTGDNRILIRNSVRYARDMRPDDNERTRIRDIHRRSLRARFPFLGDVDFGYTWRGMLGMSLNGVQFFGRVAPGIFASAAYNGVGVAIGTASGKLLADLAVGSESELLRDIQALPGPAWIPPDPLLGMGVWLTVTRLQARAGAEL